MGTSQGPDISSGSYESSDTLGAPTGAGHAMPHTELARPHPAFITDEGPNLLLENEGQIMTRRWSAVKMIASIGAIVLVAECITAGLAANAASQVDSMAASTSAAIDPQAIFTVAFAGFVEVVLCAIASFCFLFCNFHLAYFLVVGFIGLSAMGTGAYGLAVMAINMSNSVCGDNGTCNAALKKGLAAACLRVLLTYINPSMSPSPV